MKSFKTFLLETNFPGGYYDPYGNLKVYFNNAKEKEEWDSNPSNERMSDDWHYECDKENKSKADSAKSKLKTDKVVKNVVGKTSDEAQKLANYAIQQAFGDGLLVKQSVDSINDIKGIIKEIGLSQEKIAKYNKLINDYKNNEEVKKILQKKKIEEISRLNDLKNKKRRYEIEYYK